MVADRAPAPPPVDAPRAVAVVVAPDGAPAALTDQWEQTWARFDAVVVVRDPAAAADLLLRLAPVPETAAALVGASDPGPTPDPEPAAEGLHIDRARYSASWNGIDLGLTPHERELLDLLLETPRRAWTHHEIYARVWGGRWFGDPGTVHSTVKRLRAKLRAAGAATRIDAVRGVGFVLRG